MGLTEGQIERKEVGSLWPRFPYCKRLCSARFTHFDHYADWSSLLPAPIGIFPFTVPLHPSSRSLSSLTPSSLTAPLPRPYVCLRCPLRPARDPASPTRSSTRPPTPPSPPPPSYMYVCVPQVSFAPRPGSRQPHKVVYQGSDLWQVQPAWATTVHKSQGGEYPCVIMPLHHLAGEGGGVPLCYHAAAPLGR